MYFENWKQQEAGVRAFLAGQIKNTEASLPLPAYTGKYANAIEGVVDIDLMDNGSSRLGLAPMLSFQASHFHLDTFTLNNVALPGEVAFAGTVTFQFDATGAVVSMSMNGTVFNKIE